MSDLNNTGVNDDLQPSSVKKAISVDFAETFNKAFFLINSKNISRRTENYLIRFLENERYHYQGHFTFIAAKKSHYNKAVSLLSTLIESGSRTKEVFLYRGIAQAMLQNNDEAEADFKTALEIDQRFAPALHAMGALKLREGFIFESPQWFQKAIEIDPDFRTAYFNLGKNYFELNYNSAAIEYFSKAIELYSKEPMFYFFKGMALCKLNDFGNGIEDFTSAILIDPFFAEAYQKRAKASVKMGMGMNFMEDNLKHDLIIEDPSYAWMFLGEEYYKKENFKAAKKAYNQFRNSENSLSCCYCNLGDCCFMLGEYEQALSFYNKSIENAGHFSWAWFNKGVIHFMNKQYNEAEFAFINYILEIPDAPEGFLYLSSCYYMQGMYDLTIADCEQVLETNKNEAEAYNNMALAYSAKGNIIKAIELMNNAIELNGKAEYYYNRSILYDMKNESELSLRDMEKHMALTGVMLTELDLSNSDFYCANPNIIHFNLIYEYIRFETSEIEEKEE